MKITFVAPEPGFSGGIRVIAIHADRLRARGHEVVVVATKAPPPTARSILRGLMRGRWPDRQPGGSHFDEMQTELKLVDHTGPVTDADVPNADIVIATWWETAFAVAALSPAKGRKFYFVQGHEVFSPLPAHISAGSYYLPLRKITIAGWIAEAMRDRYGDHDVAVVPNSVDTELFFAPRRGKQPAPTIGLMYSAAPVKGLDTSLAAIEIARRSHPDLQVVAFGTSPPEKALPLPKGARFFLRPKQDRLREIYAMCDVWLVGSRFEGFGLPILEAMACRCPVISTRTGCAPDIIEDGITGYVVDMNDAAALGARLADVLASPEAAWQAMSVAARKRVRAYTWNDASARFERALDVAAADAELSSAPRWRAVGGSGPR